MIFSSTNFDAISINTTDSLKDILLVFYIYIIFISSQLPVLQFLDTKNKRTQLNTH